MTKQIDPLSVDFRDLQVLAMVHRTRSFSKAAEQLSVNQSAVSYTIEKLRNVFQDPLFVRQAGQNMPTRRCNEIVLKSDDITSGFTQLVENQAFDPKNMTQKITIACNYYERVLIIPLVVQKLRKDAPKLEIEIIDASGIGHEKLLSGEADLLIGPFERSETPFYRRDLHHDTYVCLMDRNHPLAGQNLTLDDYLELAHVLVTYGGLWRSRYMIELEKMGHQLPVSIRVPSPAGLELLVKDSELVATIPQRLSGRVGADLHITPCPVKTKINIRLAWAALTHQSALHQWVRETIYKVNNIYLEDLYPEQSSGGHAQ